MEAIKRKYIVDEKNNKIAVQLDIKTFEMIEDVLENYALHQLMIENEDDEKLDLAAAKKYYSKLEKSN
jgi:RelB Antitoxin